MDTKRHWENVYTTKAPDAVSWYRRHLETSLALIERAADACESSIIDVGGGESTLVDDLLLVGDIVEIELEPYAYDLWHDRAVFHFLTTPERRLAYVRQVTRAVKPGGHVIVSTFGPEGPTKCSGLEVMRYDAESLHGEFGGRFRLVESSKELHQTPLGTKQQFLYCYCRLE